MNGFVVSGGLLPLQMYAGVSLVCFRISYFVRFSNPLPNPPPPSHLRPIPGAILPPPSIMISPYAQGLSITAYSSSLPVGAGLGSSAALCVATSAALTRLSNLISGAEDDAPAAAAAAVDMEGGRRPSSAELDQINAWAFAGETMLHGTPSGLDNTVSCYGGAIKFTKGMDGKGNATEVREGMEEGYIWVIVLGR